MALRTGKKLELPVKRILQGADPDTVVSRDALADPETLTAYVQEAHRRHDRDRVSVRRNAYIASTETAAAKEI